MSTMQKQGNDAFGYAGESDFQKTWDSVPEMVRNAAAPLPKPWEEVFGPLRSTKNSLIVVGQIGQSLDGRVATMNGHSHYINGPAGLAHLHRLRAVVDAVVIGIGTALADDPQLTVRRVSGPQPARVVIDPAARLSATAKLLRDDGVRRLVIHADDARAQLPAGVETIRLPAPQRRIAPDAILAALAGLGLRRILIEGGAETVSRFLAAGCLDRLHVVVAPIIIGTGRASFTLPPIERVDDALRAPMHVHRLGDEVLFDCDLSAQRESFGSAKKST
jgi:diaminohydroxyphosphoribosylaminopyrimidine deaminase / 5-amino-6-(5-phosphoribosylamino)uracil reductase